MVCPKSRFNLHFKDQNPMEDEYSRFPMERTVKIIRRSIYVFLQNYHSFTTIAAFLAFPFAALALLSEASVPSTSLLRVIHSRFQSLFDASGFPRSSEFFTLVNLKLSQTISTCFILLPFALSFHLLAKAFVIQLLSNSNHQKKSFISLYNPLLLTQICNTLVIISANATCFCILLFFMFNCIQGLGLSSSNWLIFFSAIGVLIYSIVLANAIIICNLALILSGMENQGGYIAILKACVLIKGRSATALSLALPINLALAAIEALFQYRVVRAYYQGESLNSSMALEGVFIAYLYAILLVLDTVVGCLFYRSCQNSARRIDQECRYYSYWIEIEERDGNAYASLKTLDDLP